jgi:nitrile hydratase accessory protein
MADAVDRDVANMQGSAALPRKNGELVFEAPWQARALGMAIALHNRGLYPWDDFKCHLIAEIAEASERPRHPDASPATAYYESWLASLEHVLVDRGVLSAGEIQRRAAEFASGVREEVY